MIFLQLIQRENVKSKINIYISVVSLICSVFAIAEIELGDQFSRQNYCSVEERKERTCQMVKIDEIEANEARQF